MINPGQQKAIETTEGPVLIIAGPGTGKTFTLVKRIAHLVADKGVQPCEIMVVTFTEKAARELLTRISDEFSARGIDANINDMYIGTFHAVCLRLMKDRAECAVGKVMDSFETAYLVCRNMDKFEYLGGFSDHFPETIGRWRRSLAVCRYAGQIREELADVNKMSCDDDEGIKLLSKIVRAYNELLENNHVLDFSAIQTAAYEMLKNDTEYLAKIQGRIKYIMVDEYQDTNYIQEQLVFLIAGERQNICVVGDDDQGMYRFRGATIRNILEFPQKFPEGKCTKIHLDINYRSQPEIIDFYSSWMENADGIDLFNWDKYRYEKHLISGRNDAERINAVFRCGGANSEIQKIKVLRMIQKLKADGSISDYNQVAFLFRSVKSDEAVELGAYLEENGIPVYSPRSDMFFERQEVKQILGCMIMCFNSYFNDLKKNTFIRRIHDRLREYYKSCVNEARVLIKSDDGLYKYMSETVSEIASISGDSGKSMLDIFYNIIAFEPFRKYVKTDMSEIITNVRAARNLSEISGIISGFMNLHNMHFLSDKNKVDMPEQFFNEYLKYLYIDGIGEYEDMSEYAPHGCVSFMTIHQSKGLEFPVVVVGSMGAHPRSNDDYLMQKAEKYFNRPPYEPFADIKYFDFWRLYYTAFSRAQDMLILSERTNKSGLFSEHIRDLPDICYHDTAGRKFADVKAVKYKRIYSFTSHIAMYDDCPMQYKFYKELGFAQEKMLHTSIGSIVHESLEEINNIVISGNADKLNIERVTEIYNLHLEDISGKTGYSLSDEQRENALGHVTRYYMNRKNELHLAWRAEEEIELVMDKFILQGIVDLIEYYPEDDMFEIVDYKTGPKPDYIANPPSIAHYKKQMEIYAYLIEKRFNKPVRRMKLYYTSVIEGDPYIIFEFERENIDRTMKEITETIASIENKEFNEYCRNDYSCRYCIMRHVCGKE